MRFLKSLLRHFNARTLAPMVFSNFFTVVPFVTAFTGPLLEPNNLLAGTAFLFVGFLVTGQVVAVSGRMLDTRFQGLKRERGAIFRAWGQAWAEGLVVSAMLIGLFSLVFQSFPYYWSQGTLFAVFSLVMLVIGTLLVLGGLPYYLPVRRREGLGLAASLTRSFGLMNTRPLLALGGAAVGAIAVGANIATFGLFPGFAGLAALHQGLYDTVTEPREG